MNNIQVRRKENGLSQDELSIKSGIKVSTIQKLESGANNILGAKTETTLKLAKALNTTVEDLVGK